MNNETQPLFDRLDAAVSESRKVARRNHVRVSKSRFCFQRLLWAADEMKPKAPVQKPAKKPSIERRTDELREMVREAIEEQQEFIRKLRRKMN